MPTARGTASFDFQLQDDGGTTTGGVDMDPTPRTMTVNVTAVNDAPGNNVPFDADHKRGHPAGVLCDCANAIAITDVDALGSPCRSRSA